MSPQFLRKSSRKKGGWKNSILDFFDIAAFLIFIAGLAGIIRFFIFMPYTVEGSSMANTFHDRDFIIVDKITPKYGTLHRGDIVVFIPPGKDIPFIKRIVGLPGDTIKLQGGKTYVCIGAADSGVTTGESNPNNCTLLNEPYLGSDVQTEARCGISSFDITEGYFVMGDNRGYSTDSRCCFGLGCVSGSQYTVTTDHIIGKVFGRIYPDPSLFNKSPLQ